jgi:fimbrial chaperone protein
VPVNYKLNAPKAFLLASLCVLAPQAVAQALAIVPISQQLPAQQRSASFTLTNQSDSEALIQVRSYAWTQTARDDVYTDTTELAVSPPFAKIAAGQSQTVRLLLRKPAGNIEQAYRVVFDQIPQPVAGKVAMALRLTVPVFSSALTGGGRVEVQWRIEVKEGRPFLVALNSGTQHVQLVGLKLSDTTGETIKLKGQGLPYILAGVERIWPLADLSHRLNSGARVHLETSGPGRHWDQWLVVGKED